SHADSHNPHLQIRYPPASLPAQWLAPVPHRTPAVALDEMPRMSSHTRKFLPKSLPHEPVHARTLRVRTSTRLPPAQIHRDPQKTAETHAPARDSTNPSESSSSAIPRRYRAQSGRPPRRSAPCPAVRIESAALRIPMHPWKTCTRSSRRG